MRATRTPLTSHLTLFTYTVCLGGALPRGLPSYPSSYDSLPFLSLMKASLSAALRLHTYTARTQMCLTLADTDTAFQASCRQACSHLLDVKKKAGIRVAHMHIRGVLWYL